ncbi:MAG TPA: hypothetical protein VH087_01640 [Thermoanaerobaculia bacterium]|jgi:hypothetical protein|nr:hypothetical protein [Thermoanaerobaculia bacterium]
MTKKVLVLLAALIVAAGAYAQGNNNSNELNDGHSNHKFLANGFQKASGQLRTGSNLSDHGGPVMTAPKVVCIFWGFGAGNSYTAAMQAFRTTGMFNYNRMLSQYRSAGLNAATDMGGALNDKFDTSTPPTNVTDATVQSEVKKYFAGAEDTNTIYQVYIPSTSYSSDGTSTSCGGPSLAYCAYHGHFTDGSRDVKYSIEPYPSCSGCQTSGFNVNQNANHFAIHESREAISDPDLNAWYDRSGNEADDKCAWSPTPFIDNVTGFAYQYEWSNSAGGCVKQ